MKIHLAKKKTRHVSHDNNIKNDGFLVQVLGKYLEDFLPNQGKFQNKHFSSLPNITTEELEKLLQKIDTKKTTGFDKISN